MWRMASAVDVYKRQAQQTGFVQPYADSPMDNEQVGEEVYIRAVYKRQISVGARNPVQ